MNDKTKIRLLEFWASNPSKLMQAPDDLKSEVKKEDMENLISEIPHYRDWERSDSKRSLLKYASFLRSRIKENLEIDYIKVQKEAIQKQTELQEESKNIQKEQKEIQKIQKDISKSTKKIQIAMFIVTCMLVLATIIAMIISGLQYNKFSKLTNKQSLLIDKQIQSISPLKAHLEIAVEDENDLIINNWELAHVYRDKEGNEYFDKKEIRFIFSNIGRMTTGRINANVRSNITNIKGINIQNLIGESSQIAEVEMWFKECWGELKECAFDYISGFSLDRILKISVTDAPEMCMKINKECRENNVPLGWNKFYLEGECTFCDNETKIINKTIPFCIQDDTNTSKEICKTKPSEI